MGFHAWFRIEQGLHNCFPEGFLQVPLRSHEVFAANLHSIDMGRADQNNDARYVRHATHMTTRGMLLV